MKKKYLFLHHNFPAQFRFIASHLAELGHEVVFMSEKNFVGNIKGITNIIVDSSDCTFTNLEAQLNCANRFSSAMKKLGADGWQPDAVISHSGWGCGLDVPSIFPKSLKISYLEWWFKDNSDDFAFHPDSKWFQYSDSLILNLRRRNLSVSLELSEADIIISPSNWQKSQLPAGIQARCMVLHEGVDTSYFVINPKWKSNDTLRLTYCTRGMEPMRGFPEFVEVLPDLFRLFPNLEVLIAGNDRVAYGSIKPSEGSFGKWAKVKLQEWICLEKVKFLGHIPLPQYARLLKSSDVHCYLTRPFVVSWSLLDAMASGCCIVATDIAATREFLDPASTIWTSHQLEGSLFSSLSHALSLERSERLRRGELQRQKILENWERQQSLDKWCGLLGI